MLASPTNLSQHQRTTSAPPLSSSFSSHRSARLKTSNPSYHRNQQYSIIGLTNAAGILVERYSYTAYGTLGIYDASGTVRTTSTYANRYTYTGREYDPDLNLYHFRARWYDPATGCFISRDPLGYVDGMSLYRGYFGVKGGDPFGTWQNQDNGNTVSISIEPEIDPVTSPWIDKFGPTGPFSFPDATQVASPWIDKFNRPCPSSLELNLSAMRESLLKCCATAKANGCVEAIVKSHRYHYEGITCESEVEKIVEQVRKCSLDAVKASIVFGTPVWAVWGRWTRDGWYCDLCEECVGPKLADLKWFKYEKMLTGNFAGHTWGQIRCRATGKRLGVIDIWERYDRPWIPIPNHDWSNEEVDGNAPDFRSECVRACENGVPTTIIPFQWR